MKKLLKIKAKALLEASSVEAGLLIDGTDFPAPQGTAVVPGHVIEDMWFQVHTADHLAAAGLPNLDALGPLGDKLHSAEEFVVVPTLAERARLCARVLTKLATGEVTLPAV